MVINELTGVPGVGKSFVSKVLAKNNKVVIGNESIYLALYLGLPISKLHCDISKMIMVLLSLKHFIILIFLNINIFSLSLIKIVYNISYKLTLRRVLIYVSNEVNNDTILLVDEGPYHLPFNYLNISIPKSIKDIGYLGYNVKIILVESDKTKLVERLKVRGHWRVSDGNWDDFVEENLKIYYESKTKIFKLADQGLLKFDIVNN